jgi:hypothetical protein
MSDLPKCPCRACSLEAVTFRYPWRGPDGSIFSVGEHCPRCGAPLREDGAGPSYAALEKALELACVQLERYDYGPQVRPSGERAPVHEVVNSLRDMYLAKAKEALQQ